MLHTSPSTALVGAVPLVDLGSEMEVFDSIPQGCVGYRIEDWRSMPKLRAGEVAVVDTRQRRIRSGFIMLIAWSSDTTRRSLLQVNYRKFGGYLRLANGRKMRWCWWVDPVNRPRSRAELEHRMAAGEVLGCSDGPYKRSRLEEVSVGRVIGVLSSRAAEGFEDEEPPLPKPLRGFNPERFCRDLEKIGGSVLVDLGNDKPVSVQMPLDFSERSGSSAAHREAEAERLTKLMGYRRAQSSLRKYAVKLAEVARRTRTGGHLSIGGIIVIDRAVDASVAEAGR